MYGSMAVWGCVYVYGSMAVWEYVCVYFIPSPQLGPLGLLIVGVVSTYCMLLLVECAQYLVRRCVCVCVCVCV